MVDCCSYQQIDHTYSGESPSALCRAFYQFMMACGFAPQNVSEAMLSIGTEYDEAYSPQEIKEHNGTNCCERGAV
jgi:hypothetical protein